MLVVSGAAYWGPWYPNVRVSWADADTGTGLTWMAGVRRYFTGASYAWAGLGHGSRSLETGQIDAVLAGPAWFAEAGFDLYVFGDIKLRGYVSRRMGIGEDDSTAFGLVTGFRF